MKVKIANVSHGATSHLRRRGGISAGPVHVDTLEARLLFATTNDTMFSQQYALTTTSTPAAWDTTRGKANIVAADIDGGADYTHQDLYENIWINQAEIPASVKSKLKDTDADGRITFYDLNNSVNKPLVKDNNRNGYIDADDLLRPTSQGGWEDRINGKSNANDVYTDDIVGWDFADNDNKPFDGGFDPGHGTHTAGIIGAMGNNAKGVSGVNQKISMIIVRIFGNSGLAADDNQIAAAIRYSADSGAKVSNNSWGGNFGVDGDAIYNAIKYAGTKGQLFCAAAGNDGFNIDATRIQYNDYPAEYNLDNIVAVAAIGTTGTLTTFSNYGATHVDIAAPGNNVLSTFPGNQYVKESGTSMACPMVTGAVALTLASNKNLTWSQLKNRLLRGADQTYALNNKVWSDGKLNVKNTLKDLVGIHYPGSNFIRPAAAPLPTATASTTTTSSASSILSLASSTFSTRAIELGGDSLA